MAGVQGKACRILENLQFLVMKRALSDFLVLCCYSIGIVACLGVVLFMWGPYLAWIAEVPIHSQHKEFALSALGAARKAALASALAGLSLAVCGVGLIYHARRLRAGKR